MGTVRADNFADGAGTGKPTFTPGLISTGQITANGTIRAAGGFDVTGGDGLAGTGVPGVKYKNPAGRAVRTAGDLTTTSTSFVDVTNLTLTLELLVAGRISYSFDCTQFQSAAGFNDFNIDIGGSLIYGTVGIRYEHLGGSVQRPMSLSGITTELAAGSHTIKVQWKVNAGTGTLKASATQAAVFTAHVVGD